VSAQPPALDGPLALPSLRAITYLAPGLPAELFRLVLDGLAARVGRAPELLVDTRLSGPERGGPDPFSAGEADLGFLCAPPYLWLLERTAPLIRLLPAGFVFDDPRAAGRPAYFADVIVRRGGAAAFTELRGGTIAYNDRCSLSGYYSLLERLTTLGGSDFAHLVCSGSHLDSIRAVLDGTADAAAIDSNVLALQRRAHPDVAAALEVIESWGPFAVQPIVVRADLDPGLVEALTETLLNLHHDAAIGERLHSFGVSRFVAVDESLYERERRLLERCASLAS
jgi:phosphonate transport system substrate-binding protein